MIETEKIWKTKNGLVKTLIQNANYLKTIKIKIFCIQI